MAAGTDLSTTEVARELDECAYQIDLVGKELAHRMLDLGKWCSKAKAILEEHRDIPFSAWVSENCNVSVGYCYRAIRCHERFGDCGTGSTKIDVKAMFLLATDDTSVEAIEEAADLASSGVQVTAPIAKAIKEKHTPKKELQNERSVPLVSGSPADQDSSDFDSGDEAEPTDDEGDEPDDPVAPRKPVAKAGAVEPNNVGFYKLRIDEALIEALAGIEKHPHEIRFAVALNAKDTIDDLCG